MNEYWDPVPDAEPRPLTLNALHELMEMYRKQPPEPFEVQMSKAVGNEWRRLVEIERLKQVLKQVLRAKRRAGCAR